MLELLKYHNEKEKNYQGFEEIYSQGKNSDSPGNFGCKRTGKINRRTMSKAICK